MMLPAFRGAVQVAALVVVAGAVGLADDGLILLRHRALGLRARWKFTLIGVIAAAYSAWFVVPSWQGYGLAQTWFGAPVVLPTWAAAILVFLAVLGSTNAVNLTDGLDGLAAGAILVPLLVLSLLVAAPGFLIAAAVLGCLLVFIWFNKHPARIFMGDTGSLALGALLAGLASQGGFLLLLPLVGVVFVIEALSVIAQVVSFKTTGKRILKMSPLHHHFELLGWPERRITGMFVACSTIAAGLTWSLSVAMMGVGLK